MYPTLLITKFNESELNTPIKRKLSDWVKINRILLAADTC